MFRTQGGDFGFPYPLSGKDQAAARKYSQDLWLNNKWKHAIYPLSHVLKQFWPIPEWEQKDLEKQEARERKI
jgi:hypothetical protein